MFLTSYFLVCLHKKKTKQYVLKIFEVKKKQKKILNNLNKGKINKKKNLFIINIAFKIVHKKKEREILNFKNNNYLLKIIVAVHLKN